MIYDHPENKRELYRYYVTARNNYQVDRIYEYGKFNALGQLFYFLFKLNIDPRKRGAS